MLCAKSHVLEPASELMGSYSGVNPTDLKRTTHYSSPILLGFRTRPPSPLERIIYPSIEFCNHLTLLRLISSLLLQSQKAQIFARSRNIIPIHNIYAERSLVIFQDAYYPDCQVM